MHFSLMAFSFGATAAAPAASSGFGFNAAPTASSGFSFGATSTAPTASSGFSFGGTSAAPAASSGFSFGATPAASAASGGFNFGGAAATPAPSSGFSFGGNTAAPAASSGFSFGAKPATPSTGFGFGASTTPAAPTTSVFGAATPAASGFGFGTTATQPTTGFGSFGLGANVAQPAAAQPAGPPITLETAFEALPEDVKKNMTQFHAFLKEQDQSDAFLKTVSPRQMEMLRENMAKLEQEVLARRNRQDRQTTAVQHVRQDVRQLLHQVDAATLTRRSLDNSNGSTPNMYHVMRRVEMPSPYYWELLGHYEQKMAAIKSQIEDVEAQFKPLYEGRTGSATGAPAPAQLQQILVAQNAALMQAAARVAEVHEKAEEMRQLFLVKMQEDLVRHGENPATFQNPFDKRKKSSEADKRQAIDKIRFRTSVAPTIVTPQPAPAAPAATSAFGFGTAAAPTSGFSFGSTAASAPAKTVSFNLTSSTATSVAPPATTTSITATPLTTGGTAGGFTAPTVATTGFASSFFPPAADKPAVGSKRNNGRAQKMRK
ncbi:Nucleoporin p58/p45 [Phytophthora citrophthora]|uniref:Nucleoporin p58/p45 n=1 Tax=Phytophthora citrophthora TaxID=4793 RepID=A0AAD9G8C7_9STRA|nr:Nucleoporin p58/p45 [Phytophthora citrophthora]